eukprot:scpid26603/ scgid7409/ 
MISFIATPPPAEHWNRAVNGELRDGAQAAPANTVPLARNRRCHTSLSKQACSVATPNASRAAPEISSRLSKENNNEDNLQMRGAMGLSRPNDVCVNHNYAQKTE